MGKIVGACVSQFHDDENEFELLLAFEDGREFGHSVSRTVAREIASELIGDVGDEPALTCPHIERVIASASASDGVLAELATIREINSQLRYGTWVLKATVSAKDAEIKNLKAALTRAADQLAHVHNDSFKQAGGFGLVTSDGRDFSCFELNKCETAAREARAALKEQANA